MKYGVPPGGSFPSARPIDLAEVRIAEDALATIPAEVARALKVLPIMVVGDTLTVAIGDPMAVGTLEEIRQMVAPRVEGVWATQDSIDQRTEKCYPRN